jgi:ribosomal protein S18 acetylase RimI-like enzyme
MEIFEAWEVTDEILEAFQHLIPQLSPSSIIPNREKLHEIINSPNVELFLAKSDGKIVGTLSLVIFRTPTGTRAWIEDVVVDERARRQGIAGSLIMKALNRAKILGAKAVDLTSRPERENANMLYKKMGFNCRKTNVYRFTISP